MRNAHVWFSAIAVALVVATTSIPAATKRGSQSTKAVGPLIGFGAGALLPQGPFSEFNDPSYFIQSRSLYIEKVIGGRAAAYYGDTEGKNGEGGGRVYGFDFDFLVKFGSASTFGYVYAGAGYGTLTYSAPDPTTDLAVRHSGHDWCWTGGIGVTIKRDFYIEASYISYQTGPEATEFIPVVIGFQF